MTKNDQQYKNAMRTIITNAVCGRTVQTFQTTVYIAEEDVEPTRILGCAVKNGKILDSHFEEFTNNTINVRIDGDFEIHVWFEANGDTTITKTKANFSEIIPVETIEGRDYFEKNYFNKRILPWISKNPISMGAMVVNKSGIPTISVLIEYEIGVEIMGEGKINILSYIPTGEDKVKDDEIIFENIDLYDDVD